MIPSRFELKAQEYRAQAEAALAAAKACVLDRAREQHEQAAAKWATLAEAEEARALSHQRRMDPAEG